MIQVPDGWEIKPFSSLASINMGQSPESEFVNENQEGIAFLQGNADFGDINPKELYWVKVPKKLAKKDDILISVRAPVGDINMADKEYCIGRGLSALTIKKINQKFGFYALFQERIQLDRLAQGSTFLAIGKNDFDKLLIKYPKEKIEQEKIAKILSTLDNAIESTNRIIEKEKNIKTALMQELLANGIDQNGQIRTPQTHTYKPSELGLIPDEWEIVSLGEIGNFKNGVNKSKDDFGFGRPFINLQDVFGHWEIEHSDFDLVNATDEELKNYNLKKGDILFIRSSVKPSGVGLTALIKEDISNTIYSGFIIRFRSKEKVFNNEYKKYCFHDELFRKKLLQKSTVSANSNINQESLSSLSLLLPPVKEQIQIAKILSTKDKKIEIEETNRAKLKELKKGLMNDLLSGEVRVKV